MTRHLVPLFALLMALTTPNGKPLWLASEGVVAITGPEGDCDGRAKTRVATSNGDFCVTETPDKVKELFDEDQKEEPAKEEPGKEEKETES